MEQGGRASALLAAGLPGEDQVGWADEMRVGRRGTVRRGWGRRGLPVRQRLPLTDAWQSLVVVVNGRAGRVHGGWLPNVKAPTSAAAVGGLGRGQTELGTLVWERAPGHRDDRRRSCAHARGITRIEQPPDPPELNPAERRIEEIRRAVDGLVSDTLDDQVAAVDAFLAELDADPERVRRRAAWDWIEQAFDQLPAPSLLIAA